MIYRLSFWFFSSLLIVALLFSVSSCRTKSKKTSVSSFSDKKFDEDDFANELEDIYVINPANDSAWIKNKPHSVNDILHYTYISYEHLPLWLNENGDIKAAEALLQELDDMKSDGLDPDRYNVNKLRKELAEISQSKSLTISKLIGIDTSLTYSYLSAAHDLLFGAVAPATVDSLWFHSNDSNWTPDKLLTDQLYANGKYPSLDSFRSRINTYQLLRKTKRSYIQLQSDSVYLKAKAVVKTGTVADSDLLLIVSKEIQQSSTVSDTDSKRSQLLKNYQYFYGLKITGQSDSLTMAYLSSSPIELSRHIDVNLERLRWMQQDLEPLHLLVNIPLMELFLRRDGQDAMHMRVVVGKYARQTPALYASMANVVINPPWGVPPTIMKKDVLPGMSKSGVAYLRKKGLKVFDFKGNPVDPSVVSASNYKRFVFRQPPGDDNALGYVKFNFPNKWDIYLHDTPHREDFEKKDRALSSGCIRVQQPREMAEYILTELNGKRYPIDRIDSVIQTQKTRYEVLKNKIPVHIVYLTAYQDSTSQQVRLLKDIYKRDAKLMTALK